jgi:hypothetical protein
MKLRMTQGVFAAAVSLFLVGMSAAPARAQSGPCSNATLNGEYGFTITGQILAGPAAGPLTGVAMTSFDGQGNLSQVDHVVHNGNPPKVQWRPGTGTYTVNPDCTGTAQIDLSDGSPSIHLSIVVEQRGREVRTVVDNPGIATISLGVKRDSPL